MVKASSTTINVRRSIVLLTIIVTAFLLTLTPSEQIVRAAPGDVVWRINAGSTADLTWNGIQWSKDSFFAGGFAWNPGLLEIAGTSDDVIYSSERSAEVDVGSFNYAIDELPGGGTFPNGTYLVRLHFAEIYFPGANLRVFDVYIENQQVLNDYDIAAAVGVRTADVKEFVAYVTDNSLDIEFPTAALNRPKLSAIEIFESDGIIPTDDPTPTDKPGDGGSATPPPTDNPGGVPNLDVELEDVDLMNTPVPEIQWILPEDENNQPIHADRYHIHVYDIDGNEVLEQWFDDADICTDTYCSISINRPGLKTYLVNGYYTWTIDSEIGDQLQLNAVDRTFRVDMDVPFAIVNEDLIDTSTGRVILNIPRDPGAFWYQIWLGTHDPETDIYNQLHNMWYQKTTDWCSYESCRLLLDVHLPNNDLDYLLYIRAWGPGGYSLSAIEGGWSDPYRFTMDFDAPLAVTAMTVTGANGADDHPDFLWQPVNNATWYNIWVGSSEWDRVDHFNWYTATDLGCADDDQCELRDPVALTPADRPHIWYVRSWGPGGFSTGGLADSGWAEGAQFMIP